MWSLNLTYTEMLMHSGTIHSLCTTFILRWPGFSYAIFALLSQLEWNFALSKCFFHSGFLKANMITTVWSKKMAVADNQF